MIRRLARLISKEAKETGERIRLVDVSTIASRSADITSIFSGVMCRLKMQNEVIQREKQTRIDVIEKLQDEHRELEQIELHNNKVIDKIEDIIL